MNDMIQLIGAAFSGGAITGVATLFATYITNRQKVQEIQLRYQMKLEDSYREQAHLYIDSLYKPLNKVLYTLYEDYSRLTGYREHPDDLTQETLASIHVAFTAFFTSVSSLLHEGDSGYLTPDLDLALHRFLRFLRCSLMADMPSGPTEYLSFTSRGEWTFIERFFLSPDRRYEMKGYRYYVLYAPVGSSLFQERFFDEVLWIQSLLREVMLKKKT
jgi:hypothetical protein